MNLDEFRVGIKYLGLTQMTNSEIVFIFETMNRFEPGRLKKDRFCHQIKKDIPASLSKVVNVKEILFDSFERILADYVGKKSSFPIRESNESLVGKTEQIVPLKGDKNKAVTKMSIFQRMRSKTKRRKTIKAPIKSAFGSNVAEIAENGREIMDDIILSMVNEDDAVIRGRTDSAIITADEFRQLFSRSFVMFGCFLC